MGCVALEIPLSLFAFSRGRERDDAADSWVQPLHDALDHSAFACGIAPFEDYNDLCLGVLNPVLQLDELGLQREKMLEVLRSIDRRRVTALVNLSDFFRQRRLGQFEFKVLVQRVGQLRLKPIIAARTLVHPSLHRLQWYGRSSATS